MFIRELLEALGAAKIRYCIVGGVAMNLHGVPRMTYDLDLVVVPDRGNLHATEEVLMGLGLQPRIPVPLGEMADREQRERMRDERNLVAVTFTDPANPLREVDVLVAPSIDAEELVARSTLMPMPGSMVYVASIVDLIAMKRATGRAQDTADVAHLERLRRG
jgi:hypothetical protein